MRWLPHKDIQILMNCIGDIYSDMNPDGWHSRLLSVISRAIPSNHITYNKINPIEQKFVYFERPCVYVSPKDIPICEKYMHEHPLVKVLYPALTKSHPFEKNIKDRLRRHRPDYIRHPEGRALKISDLLTDNQFRRTGLYHEFFRKYDTDYQICLPLSYLPDTVEGVSFNRDGKDFTERDRLMLNLLGPHIIQAYRNVDAIPAIRRNVQVSAGAQARAIDNLTLKESEVLHWLAQGKGNAQIAIILNIAEDTVKKHLMRIYQKLGVENRIAAALMAVEKFKGI
ncbi:MAG: hypothetical protein HY265_07495 [Deltaproteobacteria bacterium]|nr:hypothetical protein [Deltaproteobacteria bacterium]